MDLGQFDLVTAFCTLYYLSQAAMAKTVAHLASLTDTLVLQCNDENWIDREDAATFEKASLKFNAALVRSNGFPQVSVIETSGSQRPLVIGRTRAEARAHPGKHYEFMSADTRAAGHRSFGSEQNVWELNAVGGRASVIIPAHNGTAQCRRTLSTREVTAARRNRGTAE
jgi:hypothetical protein